jgi:hypothetical protein
MSDEKSRTRLRIYGFFREHPIHTFDVKKIASYLNFTECEVEETIKELMALNILEHRYKLSTNELNKLVDEILLGEGKCSKCGKGLPEPQMVICAECMGPLSGVHMGQMPSEERSCESCYWNDGEEKYPACLASRSRTGKYLCIRLGGEVERWMVMPPKEESDFGQQREK